MKSRPALVLYYPKPNRFSIGALAGALESHERFRDLPVAFPTDPAELRHAVRGQHGSTVVGISFMTPQVWSALGLVKSLKQEFPRGLVVVAGGPHPSAEPEACLRAGSDIVVIGEGEKTFPELLLSLADGGDGRGLPGTASLDGQGRLRLGPRRRPVDLDDYPPFAPGHGKFSPIEITRGCPYGCGFCQTSRLCGGRPRHRSPQAVAEYAGLLASRGMRDLRVVTPNAFSYGSADGRTVELDAMRDLLKAVCRAQGPRGRLFFGSMPSEVRPEHVTEAALRLVRQYAANDNLAIGAQSGSQRVLDLCRRGHTVADIKTAVARTLAAGLKANVDFIFGLPGETEADAELTFALMRRLTAMGACIRAHAFTPLPQTRMGRRPWSPVPERFLEALDRMTASGSVRGLWKEQARQAARIAAYLKAS